MAWFCNLLSRYVSNLVFLLPCVHAIDYLDMHYVSPDFFLRGGIPAPFSNSLRGGAVPCGTKRTVIDLTFSSEIAQQRYIGVTLGHWS
jgi:hypothetical protein